MFNKLGKAEVCIKFLSSSVLKHLTEHTDKRTRDVCLCVCGHCKVNVSFTNTEMLSCKLH